MEQTKAKRMYMAEEVKEMVKVNWVTGQSQIGKEDKNSEYDSAALVETSGTLNDKLNDSTDLCYPESANNISCRLATTTYILREVGAHRSPQQERSIQFYLMWQNNK